MIGLDRMLNNFKFIKCLGYIPRFVYRAQSKDWFKYMLALSRFNKYPIKWINKYISKYHEDINSLKDIDDDNVLDTLARIYIGMVTDGMIDPECYSIHSGILPFYNIENFVEISEYIMDLKDEICIRNVNKVCYASNDYDKNLHKVQDLSRIFNDSCGFGFIHGLLYPRGGYNIWDISLRAIFYINYELNNLFEEDPSGEYRRYTNKNFEYRCYHFKPLPIQRVKCSESNGNIKLNVTRRLFDDMGKQYRPLQKSKI